ncbi:exported hypothetical protein [Candidatus Sulfopaludibacter sp. SbA3]|nr:exported hypothetical protein [Candidatus Sulfopaludibacter sp. SbA3]
MFSLDKTLSWMSSSGYASGASHKTPAPGPIFIPPGEASPHAPTVTVLPHRDHLRVLAASRLAPRFLCGENDDWPDYAEIGIVVMPSPLTFWKEAPIPG